MNLRFWRCRLSSPPAEGETTTDHADVWREHDRQQIILQMLHRELTDESLGARVDVSVYLKSGTADLPKGYVEARLEAMGEEWRRPRYCLHEAAPQVEIA